MLNSRQLRNLHKSGNGLLIEYLSVWREHRAKLEADYLRQPAADFSVNFHLLGCRLAVQPRGLEEDRNSAELHNSLDLALVERNQVSLAVLDISARHKLRRKSQRFASQPKDAQLLRIGQIVHIAGVQVHRVHKTRGMGSLKVGRK